jgi:LSD1 subclass zinc finger protein
MQHPQQLQQQHAAMTTTQCMFCSIQLSYPSGSMYIQCPACHNTMNPQPAAQSFVHCVGCSTLLSHPPQSVTIQCPKCKSVMDLPQRVNQMQPQPPIPPNQRKQKKKRKDPHAPKRAANAYMIFCRERRAELKKDRPDLPFGQLGAKLGEMWRAMSQAEKKPFEEKAAADRERYKNEMANYSPSDPSTRPPKKTKEDPAGDAPLDGSAAGAAAPLPLAGGSTEPAAEPKPEPTV